MPTPSLITKLLKEFGSTAACPRLQPHAEPLEPRVYLGGFAAGPYPNESHSGSTFLDSSPSPVTEIHYDYRDVGEYTNQISSEQIQATDQVLAAWSRNSGGTVQFIHNTSAPDSAILNIGVGDMAAFGGLSVSGGKLGIGGGTLRADAATDASSAVTGFAWLDAAEQWNVGGVTAESGYDFFTAMSHEVGHALGFVHTADSDSIMAPDYLSAASATAFSISTQNSIIAGLGYSEQTGEQLQTGDLMAAADGQLSAEEVSILLQRASAATDSEDAIIAVCDRGGRILGVQIEDGVIAPNDEVLSFMVDGAVAKARTAAFFSNGDPDNQPQSGGTLAPLTSRTVRFLSQSTITQREVESNPNAADPTLLGPGFVAPVGLGGHFPPEIMNTPVVDLFAIEHTNRDSLIHAGANGIRESGGGDDILLSARFDADFIAGQEIDAPESYGLISGIAPAQQSRGIATLPGGIPIFRDTNADGFGDELVGGIGVFFPGPDGYATYEQGFIAGAGQSELERTNADRVLEAEYIAFAAAGGSLTAESFGTGAAGASSSFENIAGLDRVEGLDLPFGTLTLAGITLPTYGSQAGIEGVRQLVGLGDSLAEGAVSGRTQIFGDGIVVPDGWLVAASDGNGIRQAEVQQIIEKAIDAAQEVRAAVRLPISSQTRMVFAITDLDGEVVGLYRMQDATVFSLDVAVAKARNVRYLSDATAIQPADMVDGLDPGVAVTNRTVRFLAEPRFPNGVDGSEPPQFSTLRNPSVDSDTAENSGMPAAAAQFDSVLGYDAFHVGTNFRDSTTPLEHQNGVVFFPGSTPLYRDGELIGGFGVSGDGVDQDDVVTFLAAGDFLPGVGTTRADQVTVDGVRLPYMKFLRNPFAAVR